MTSLEIAVAARAEWKHCFRRNPAFASSWLIRTRTLWRQRRSNFLRKDQITPFPLHELNICGGLMSERARLMRPCSTSELYSFCNMYKKKSNPLQALAYLAIAAFRDGCFRCTSVKEPHQGSCERALTDRREVIKHSSWGEQDYFLFTSAGQRETMMKGGLGTCGRSASTPPRRGEQLARGAAVVGGAARRRCKH